MANFNVVQLVDAVTITGPQGIQGIQGATGATGAAGPGAGAFEVDADGNLTPTSTMISEAFFNYDGNNDVQPAA